MANVTSELHESRNCFCKIGWLSLYDDQASEGARRERCEMSDGTLRNGEAGVV
jgi:hypothetical protein